MERINIKRDASQAAKLADAKNVVSLLDAIPGARERAEVGLQQARAGETVRLDEL